ncbi:MAG: alpha/beta hydrolase [Patescibacteria group bacterium]|nr:alpha/beta hydrolase [Patescibacteria group bacterium]
MKNAIIFHGTGSTGKYFWFPYLKEKLEKKGFEVWLPDLPNKDNPNINELVPFVLKNGKFNSETVLIGHSSGAQLILNILEKIDIKIEQAILVSGYAESLAESANSNIKPDLDWNKIKENVENIIFINSDNDPWGWDDKQGRAMFNKLGGIQIIMHNEGHMGSVSYNQPYKEFPLLVDLIH